MPGIAAVVSAKPDGFEHLRINYGAISPLVIDEKRFDRSYVARFTNTKFLADKVFADDDEILVGIDGVIFNFAELKAQYLGVDYFDTTKRMYKNVGTKCFQSFIGEFAGMLFDKLRDRWIIFTNHTGSKPLYYYNVEGLFVVASQLDVIVQVLRAWNRRYTLDQFAAYCLLSYGFMLEDRTLISEVKRLKPGNYLVLEAGAATIESYVERDRYPRAAGSVSEIIDRLDGLFNTAVRRAYDKDAEYGYAHLTTLSGGLDSRMNLWVANKHGYTPLIAMTFSENDYLDERIAKRIAGDLKTEFLFYSLSSGHYLISAFEDAVRANGGLVLFSGAAHLLSALRRISMEGVGMLHMGQCGDAIIGGSFLASSRPSKAGPASGAYSHFLLDRIAVEVAKIIDGYESEESYLLYNRGFNGALNGNWITYQYTECTSPFLDRDFMSYALSIPRALRYRSRIYRDWILAMYPEAGRYTWEHSKARLSDPLWWHQVSSIIWKGRMLLTRNWSQQSMNPTFAWYRDNAQLREWTDAYWRNNAYLLESYPELKRDCDRLFHAPGRFLRGPLVARTQVMTLLEAVGCYWGREER